jgi:DNA-directed RNA polymerase subunit RPC12/RpoP
MDGEVILDEKQVAATINKCSSCGAEMKYDIATGMLKCEHCGNEQKIETDDIVLRKQMADVMKGGKDAWGRTVFRCSNCGAKEVLESKSINTCCPFCGSTNIVSTEELSGIKPDCIIPFKITPDKAHGIFKIWMQKAKFAPRKFKKYSDIRERVTQLYMPSWSFTTDAYASYSGTMGRRVTTMVRDSNGNMIPQTKIVYFNVSGQISRRFADYLVQSSSRISQLSFSKLKPFNLAEKKPYRTEFVAGIAAEHYSRSLNECFVDFENFIKSELRKDIMHRHNADFVQSLKLNLTFPTKEFNYCLLPVYLANYNYNAKTYNFYINGMTGKIVGRYPVSKTKVFILTLLGIVAAAAVAFVYLKYFR